MNSSQQVCFDWRNAQTMSWNVLTLHTISHSSWKALASKPIQSNAQQDESLCPVQVLRITASAFSGLVNVWVQRQNSGAIFPQSLSCKNPKHMRQMSIVCDGIPGSITCSPLLVTTIALGCGVTWVVRTHRRVWYLKWVRGQAGALSVLIREYPIV